MQFRAAVHSARTETWHRLSLRLFVALPFFLSGTLLRGSTISPSDGGTAPFGVLADGRPRPALAAPGTEEVVLFFAATDCPISNRYLPEIARLSQQFRARHVEVLSVYPNPTDTQAVVATHEREFGPAGETVRDPQQRLVQFAHARLTPEAAVLVPSGTTPGWRVVYLGRIDDRYLSLGQERPVATRHDLERAMRDALTHSPVAPPGGPAVGCGIVPVR